MATSPNPGEQSFTRAYDVDVFVSYGHLDNQKNWVTNFHSSWKRAYRNCWALHTLCSGGTPGSIPQRSS